MAKTYVCAELVANTCQRWEEFSWLPVLEKGQGMEIGWIFLGMTIAAWGFRIIIKQLLFR